MKINSNTSSAELRKTLKEAVLRINKHLQKYDLTISLSNRVHAVTVEIENTLLTEASNLLSYTLTPVGLYSHTAILLSTKNKKSIEQAPFFFLNLQPEQRKELFKLTLSLCKMMRKLGGFKDYSLMYSDKGDMFSNMYLFKQIFSEYIDFHKLPYYNDVYDIVSSPMYFKDETEPDKIRNHYGFYQIRKKVQIRFAHFKKHTEEMVNYLKKENVLVRFSYSEVEVRQKSPNNFLIWEAKNQKKKTFLLFDIIHGKVFSQDEEFCNESSLMHRKEFLLEDVVTWKEHWLEKIQFIIEENELVNEFHPDTHFLKVFLETIQKQLKDKHRAPSLSIEATEKKMLQMMNPLGGYQPTVLLLKKLTETLETFYANYPVTDIVVNIRILKDYNLYDRDVHKKVILEIHEEQSHYFLMDEKQSIRNSEPVDLFVYSNDFQSLWSFIK